jgi:hypothetical protein
MSNLRRKRDRFASKHAESRMPSQPAAVSKSEPAPIRKGDAGPLAPASLPDRPASVEPSVFETRLHELITTFWSYKDTITASTGIGVLLGLLAAFAMGPSYTATAVVQPSLISEAPAKGVQAPTLDANLLLESEVQLILLQPLPNALTLKLNREFPQGRGGRSLTALVSSAIADTVANIRNSARAVDPAATEDVSLEVGYRKRTYLIEVSARASTPERAAAFANAVAGQYVRQTALKQLKAKEMAAEQALSELMLSYGDRHPLVLRTQSDLIRIKRDLDVLTTTPSTLDASDFVGGITAVPAVAPSGRNSSYRTIAIWGLLGLLSALGFVLFKERKRLVH